MSRFVCFFLALAMTVSSAAPVARASAQDDILKIILQKQEEVGKKKAELEAFESHLARALEDMDRAERSHRNRKVVYAVGAAGFLGLSALLIRSGNGNVGLNEAVAKILGGLGLGATTVVTSTTLYYLSYRNLKKVEAALVEAKESAEVARRALQEQLEQLCAMKTRAGYSCE